MVQAPEEWNILSMLEWGTEYLEEKGISAPRLSMEWLLADLLKVKRLDLYLKYDRPLSGSELNALKPLIMRRARHEPLQYIIGHTDFIYAQIRVTPDVLIPRPETEQLVQLILEQYGTDTAVNMVDAGTGSGCIPIAIKMERPEWTVSGFDISDAALNVARINARQNETDIKFFKADLTDATSVKSVLTNPVDLFISNPPYIHPDEKESLEPEVKDFEPALALFSNKPVLLYRQLISTAVKVLKPGGMIFLEIHEDYGNQIKNLFDRKRWETKIEKDYSQKNRFIKATLR